ncbi:hypothetical protein QQS21_008868 [Conoideocrella luteorostrata]|uniref:Malate dehydrogenase n=1 Tax=Conoideocrella luteorostrata TaxID=1105319 RepID=A0AAJ0CIW1_9HYPO|nr:hypothetical protein QQS21_008868 [Conoideocrella luteorostrata]
MFKSSTILLFSAAVALGLPTGSCAPGPKALVLPSTGAADLPQPPAGSKLLHIALGFGIQNYTCSSVGATPGATGALAMLYDITDLFPGQNRQSLSQNEWDSLTTRALWSHNVPLNLNYSAEGRVEPSSPGASQTSPFPPDAPLQLLGMRPVPFLGHHLFTSAGVPNFILDGGKINVLAGKLGSVDAPKNADKGPQRTGAVSWLQLNAKDGSVGAAKYVYRVATAGGNSHGCSKAAGQDSTSYTAQYWFYS